MADRLNMSSVQAHAKVVAEHQGGRTRCTVLRSAPPLTLRSTSEGVHLVGSMAGPLGGDDMSLSISVGAGAELIMRGVAATVVLPGAKGEGSIASLDVEVGAGGTLRWLLEPTILAKGCEHVMTTSLRLTASSTLIWREEIVLGRHGETSGSLLQRLRVDLDGRPLLRTDLAVGPRWPEGGNHNLLGPGRAIGMALVVAPNLPPLSVSNTPEGRGVRAAVLHLENGAALINAVATDPGSLRRVLDDVLRPWTM